MDTRHALAPTDQPADVSHYFRDCTASDAGGLFRAVFGNDRSDIVARQGVSLHELRRSFEASTIPGAPIGPEAYGELLEQQVLPHVVNVASPSFIGHMTSPLPTFVPELSRLLAQLNQNVVKVETSKVLTLLERQVLAMMHRLFFQGADADYGSKCQDPAHVFGVMTSGGTVANITALACARNLSLLRLGVTRDELVQRGATAVLRERGLSRPVLLASRLAHYSLRKAASLLGMGENDIVTVAQDERQRLSVHDLTRCIEHCRARGEFIVAMVGIAGATETGTIDPLEEMARVAAAQGIHFHVDAAWGGALMFSEAHRHKLRGIEQADTITFCAHKQLYAAQGSSMCLFRDPRAAHAHSFNASYQARTGSYDLGQFSFEGSRPANSMMLHAVLHLFAREGMGWIVDRSMRLTTAFRRLIELSEEFELIGEPQMNIVNYRYVPRNLRKSGCYTLEQNRLISGAVEKIQEEQFHAGRTFVSRTSILSTPHGAEPIGVFRVVLANPLTTCGDLRRVLLDQLAIAHRHVEHASTPPELVSAGAEE